MSPIEIVFTLCNHIVFYWQGEMFQFDWREGVNPNDAPIVQAVKDDLIEQNFLTPAAARLFLNGRNY